MPKPVEEKVQKPVLSIPVPHRISGDVNSMLDATLQERFASIILVKKAEKDVKKGTVVLSRKANPKDPKTQVSEVNAGIGHLSRFVFALTDAYFSGMGLSGDGSAKYVSQHQAEVFKVIPNLKEYDLYIVPAGRGGCAKYRASVQELVSQVVARAKIIQTSLDEFGVMAGKERTKKGVQAPEITVQF